VTTFIYKNTPSVVYYLLANGMVWNGMEWNGISTEKHTEQCEVLNKVISGSSENECKY